MNKLLHKNFQGEQLWLESFIRKVELEWIRSKLELADPLCFLQNELQHF